MFFNIKTSPCDIFIKLSDKKFVKIISINSSEDPIEVIKKYITKGAKEIFVLTKDLNKIKGNLAKEIFKIDTSKSIEKQKLQIADSVMALAKDFGVSEFMINGINDTFKELSDDLNKDNKFESLLALIKKNEGTILGNHSYLTAIFSVMIASKTNWATSNVRKNLTTAAILHDLDLIDSPNYRYEFKSIAEINELPTQMCHEFKSHPTKLATQLAKNNSIPTDVINLIAKHHEGSSREKSYPMGILSSQLTPPNCVFNVAHHFSMELAALGFNFSKGKIALQKTREFYEGSAMIQTFIDLLEKELVL
jgi:HD-GYP domain-containing protein (c-di-GMP phosphodiesterase class II)